MPLFIGLPEKTNAFFQDIPFCFQQGIWFWETIGKLRVDICLFSWRVFVISIVPKVLKSNGLRRKHDAAQSDPNNCQHNTWPDSDMAR